MNKQEIITNDIKVPNKDMEVLRKHFPHCFDKNGDFQIDKFRESKYRIALTSPAQ